MKIVYISQLYNKTYLVNRHCHKLWEIVYYTEGSGTVNIDGQLVPFCAGDLFAFPPNIPHFDYSDEGFTNYHFNFSDEEFNYKTYQKIHDTEDHAMLTLLKLMHKEYYLKRPNYEKIMDSLYEALRHYLFSFTEKTYENGYVSTVINEIIANLSNPDYNVNQTLDAIPLNNGYLRKLFEKETGKTPLQYLLWKRMLAAKRLLRSQAESGLTIKEIAYMCGYSDYYYFSRVFKQETGTSPRFWREPKDKKPEERKSEDNES